MADTLNVTKDNGTVTDTQGKTFTQDEVNVLIQNRLAEVKGKYSDYEELKAKASKYDEAEEANKSELQKATERADALQKQIDAMTKEKELSDMRTKVSKDTQVPVELLTGATEEECTAQANAILQFAKPNAYPSVKDGGETIITGKKTEAELFEEWFNAQ